LLNKVISGGQTGVDLAALKAAKALGIPTGGWMPKGWKTLEGPRPTYADLYGMKEHSSANYQHRTWDNVGMADGTLRLYHNKNSPGEKCTMNGIIHHNKPYYDVNLTHWSKLMTYQKENLCFIINNHLILAHNIKVLNVAGNSERTAPGIEAEAFELLTLLFKETNGLA
jgi:hypothetical protein